LSQSQKLELFQAFEFCAGALEGLHQVLGYGLCGNTVKQLQNWHIGLGILVPWRRKTPARMWNPLHASFWWNSYLQQPGSLSGYNAEKFFWAILGRGCP